MKSLSRSFLFPFPFVGPCFSLGNAAVAGSADGASSDDAEIELRKVKFERRPLGSVPRSIWIVVSLAFTDDSNKK